MFDICIYVIILKKFENDSENYQPLAESEVKTSLP